jgi:toxin YoeB
MKQLKFDGIAFKDFTDWASTDKKVFLKIIELLKNIDRDPYKGPGKPEPLKFNKSRYWSRRINEEHRLVYKIDKEAILIASCKGHY